jgi:hypothetical protein
MDGSLTLAGVHSGACVIFAAFFAAVDFTEVGALVAFGRVAFVGLARCGVTWLTVVSAGVTVVSAGISGAVIAFDAADAGFRACRVDGCLGAFSCAWARRGACRGASYSSSSGLGMTISSSPMPSRK